jgi:hypothetical protein
MINFRFQVGLELLNDFFWLKRNATAMLPAGELPLLLKKTATRSPPMKVRPLCRALNHQAIVEKTIAIYSKFVLLATIVWDFMKRKRKFDQIRLYP